MTHAVIPAAGRGERMGSTTRKQFLSLCGRPVIVHTLSVFQDSSFVDDIICVASEDDRPFLERLVAGHGLTKVKRILPGGARRQDSVQAAIEYLETVSLPDDIVLVHDGVRPLVTPELIKQVTREAQKSGGAVAALPVTDSLKEVSDNCIIRKSIPREQIWSMQTPQAFRLSLLIEAYRKAVADDFYGTDEAMLVERTGAPIRCIPGSSENIKITTPADLKLAELLLSARSASERGADRVSS